MGTPAKMQRALYRRLKVTSGPEAIMAVPALPEPGRSEQFRARRYRDEYRAGGSLEWGWILNLVVWLAIFVAGAAWRLRRDTARV